MNNIRGLRSIPLDEQQRKLLVNRRRELGLSQKRLAEKLNVMQVSIHSYEVGKTQPTPELLEKVCEALALECDVSVYVYLRPKRERVRGGRR